MFGIASPAEQYRIAQGNLNLAMQAIAEENESRVNQRREMRRLGMDYETERLRQMGANQRAQIDAVASLIRELLAGM
jgi:superfamily I DNA/RNA helicase